MLLSERDNGGLLRWCQWKVWMDIVMVNCLILLTGINSWLLELLVYLHRSKAVPILEIAYQVYIQSTDQRSKFSNNSNSNSNSNSSSIHLHFHFHPTPSLFALIPTFPPPPRTSPPHRSNLTPSIPIAPIRFIPKTPDRQGGATATDVYESISSISAIRGHPQSELPGLINDET